MNAWLSHPSFKDVVEKSWRDADIIGWGSYVFKEKLKRLKEALKMWNRDHFGSIDTKISLLRKEIKDLDERDDLGRLSEEEAIRRREIMAQLLLQLNNKKSLLSQKARLRWLREGDVNSKTFHRAINYRRNINRLMGLEIRGDWIDDPRKVKEAVREHFQNLFARRTSNMVELPEDLFENRLSVADGDLLIRPFSVEEIRQAVWDCEGDKSPGPDGFSMIFYRNHWDIIKDDLIRVFTEFHINGRLARGCNSSYIALIPKKEGASILNHFRPISLIGSLYKIVAKVLASRIKLVIGNLIGVTQSAFIKGRFILDGVVVLNEAIEEAKKSKVKRIIFKADFAKAFDSICWDYLLDVMKKMCFPIKWINWIRECISTAKANVLVNGSPSGEFDLERGLRQGDPLSPLLFLIAAEGLSLLVDRAVNRGLLKAAEIGRNKVKLSHIQYADDTMFIVNGEKENAMAIRRLLNNFEIASGLSVNFDKSWVFGINMEREEMMEAAKELGCRVGELPISYLGLKLGGRLAGLDGWGELIEKVKRRIRRWHANSISIGGRITIIKSILSAMPVYGMSVLPLPSKAKDELKGLLRNFLWGGKEGDKKMAWIKWDELCRTLGDGGLGFKDFGLFNQALLSKWI